ncbi:glycosyltransferase [Mycobacterium nebraskense]|uniref:4,4'-diaponeurosporenoate glycosyltransferase n=1 Tax=Mycobacterium nebraskense TaxID=244292 RepID=A0A0F5N818_9MYCO|nr:glycosyltransferase family 2 protein [Mycobacterium nebraskense]KKC03102.1 glycosyl transferase [Mycobacterium nebraskense]KLO33815.1 glycosyl transferase [Mycobacterium nebraskense]ORW22967.1 glycosyl transferase [Mycobacterium nebraskense]
MSTAWLRAYDAAAVVIPAHNERAKLPACLRAVLTAALCAPIPVTIVVVLDDCDDGSDQLAGEYGPDVHFISVDAHNVGAARAVGFGYARSLFGTDTRCWYATTDADSRVDPGWLVHQLEVGDDMVLGVVRVTDWGHHGAEVAQRYLQSYQADPVYQNDHHDHIHGANMGFSARAYWRVGGFRALASGEDVDLAERLEAAGYRIHRDTELSVITSARTQARAPHGFAHHLRQLGRSVAGDCA